jgi:hypothetical protein
MWRNKNNISEKVMKTAILNTMTYLLYFLKIFFGVPHLATFIRFSFHGM